MEQFQPKRILKFFTNISLTTTNPRVVPIVIHKREHGLIFLKSSNNPKEKKQLDVSWNYACGCTLLWVHCRFYLKI